MTIKRLIQPGMRVAVMGLGITGQAAVRYLLGCGAEVMVSDCRGSERFSREAGATLAAAGVRWEADGHTYDFLRSADLVVVSPGVPQDHEVIEQLKADGIAVVGELAVAAPHLEVPVIAVTGTNGKTTVTSLVGEIMRTAGRKVFVGGNIGTPLLDFLHEGGEAEVIVLEVSSFQLLMAGDFRPDVGLLLNITPDHLDRHGSMDEYAEAKMLLFRHQTINDTAVLCGDDENCMARAARIPGRVQTFGRKAECTARIDGVQVSVDTDSGHEMYDLTGTPLANAIGASNSAAAILAVRAVGVEADTVRKALASFQPGPHRLQKVAEYNGVSYVNDSKATNTGAAIAALEQVEGKAVLIAGGREKGEDYSLLCDVVQRKARAVIVIGEAADSISQALKGCVPVDRASTMADAVIAAEQRAEQGDTVLLSPACASFDMFNSYGHRGEVFAASVRQMLNEFGVRAGEGES